MRAVARVFVCRPMPVEPSAVLGGADVRVFEANRPPTRDEIVTRASGAEALVTFLSDAVDGPLLDSLPTVRVVANFAVGYDNVDVPACTERGVWVTNTPDVLT
jgi:glyoxylate reductase